MIAGMQEKEKAVSIIATIERSLIRFYAIFKKKNRWNVIESNHESRFAPKTMKTAATDRSIDMDSEGC